MPNWTCALADIQTDVLCADSPGLLTVFMVDDSVVDWDTVTYDDPTFTLSAWVLATGESFAEVTFERKNGRLDALYTKANGYYEVSLLNMILKGHSTARTLNMGNLVACCGLVCQVHDNIGQARIIGKEHASGAWLNPLERGNLTRHLDTTGAFGDENDRLRDEFDIGAQHVYPLPYSSVTVSTMRSYVGPV